MRLLLDTHAFLWSQAEPDRLSQRARDAIVDSTSDVFVSVASAWELCIKIAAGKLREDNFRALLGDANAFATSLHNAGFQLLPIQPQHIFATRELPLLHRDPFDRMLVAQARIEGLTLVTNDEVLAQYPVAVMRT